MPHADLGQQRRIFARQKSMGWIPADTKLTPRAATMAAWFRPQAVQVQRGDRRGAYPVPEV